MRRSIAAAAVAALVTVRGLSTSELQTGRGDESWPYYGHDAGGMRYSPLQDVNRRNVAQLRVAWTAHTGDPSVGRRIGFETTPIVIDGTLYFTTGLNRVIALDPANGAQRWTFDPHINPAANYGDGLINRGVATWLDERTALDRPCRRRIFEATLDARLIALDAVSGKPCADFGTVGEVSLRNVSGYLPGVYHMTSPPAVVDDVVIVGSGVNDNGRTDEPAGVVRAFDARSGALRWSWDPIPLDTAARTGAANAWSVMAVDAERHLVFVPTGSASPDYYGGQRPGDNKWANSVVALRADTGAFVWGFQMVHHDLWDYDTAAPPLLTTLTRDGRSIPVVIQSNKTGLIYVLNRETGAPVLPIEERRVPQSDLPGEMSSPTQPFPQALPATAPVQLSENDLWGATAADLAACRERVRALRNNGIFTPPSRGGSVAVPGNVGGSNWSGYAFDPTRGLLILNTNNLPAEVRMTPRADFKGTAPGEDWEVGLSLGTPYVMARRYLRAPSGLPCSRPPWGTLVAVDINRGSILWEVALGSMQLLAPKSVAPPGSISLGGPIATAGGLVFVAGTIDPYLRAVDVETGRELWKAELPASGHATPITYKIGGTQYVVIAAGGHPKLSEEPAGDALIAFALSN